MELFLGSLCIDDEEACQKFSDMLTDKKLAVGEVLFDYNDSADDFFFLREGHLAVYKFTGFLEKMQVIALLDPGSFVGEGAILQQQKRNTRVTAIKESRLSGISHKQFLDYQKRYPQSANQVLKYFFSIVSLRLEKTSERLACIL